MSTRPTSSLLRLAACLALLLALVAGEIGHDHGALDSPDLCATCSATLHAPVVPSVAAATVDEPEPRLREAELPESPRTIVVRAPVRSRAPPSI